MIFFAILLKAFTWFMAFRCGVGSDRKGMLLQAASITVFLTVVDSFTVAANLRFSATLLTLLLYALMSFTLFPLAWKVKNRWFTLACNVTGMLGALAGVNFTMDLLRGLFPVLYR